MPPERLPRRSGRLADRTRHDRATDTQPALRPPSTHPSPSNFTPRFPRHIRRLINGDHQGRICAPDPLHTWYGIQEGVFATRDDLLDDEYEGFDYEYQSPVGSETYIPLTLQTAIAGARQLLYEWNLTESVEEYDGGGIYWGIAFASQGSGKFAKVCSVKQYNAFGKKQTDMEMIPRASPWDESIIELGVRFLIWDSEEEMDVYESKDWLGDLNW